MLNLVNSYVDESCRVINSVKTLEKEISSAISVCTNSLMNGNKIIFCGNGGSAAESQHFAAELSGRFLKDREPLASVALTVDSSALTAIGNDYGFESVFSRQLSAIGNVGDVLVGMSTSGTSQNIINAFNQAQKMGIEVIALVGRDHSSVSENSDIIISVDSEKTNFIQEAQLVIGHYICGVVEENIFGSS